MRAEKKRALRAAALSQRGSLSEVEVLSRSHLIQGRALHFPRYLSSSAVALYCPIQNEIATDQILNHALIKSKKVFYPRTGSPSGLELIQIDSVADLQAGRFGIPEPTGNRRLSDADAQDLIVFVPGVGFDLRGNRLGRGYGGYDRLLAGIGPKAAAVGLAYEFQLVDEMPAEEWDQKVHFIITEDRVIDCGGESLQPRRMA
ncbi:MAG TPA: 5-formyltetrahydrofolate cyclo-ligase [Candidatus Binatia bacterium]|nr:5-formyltetrahydrofolate cyclo-ligase [Candidatus Binatia bacterium]